MHMFGRSRSVSLFAVLTALCSSVASAGSLKANIGEVMFKNLQPGQTYNLTDLMGVPLRLVYTDLPAGTVYLVPVQPAPSEISVKGFSPVPDPRWLEVRPATTPVEGSGQLEASVLLTIPDAPALRGGRYIAMLWAKNEASAKGMHLGLGVKSRFMFTIAETSAPALSAMEPATPSLNFAIHPQYAALPTPVRAGRSVKLDKWAKKRFFIENKSDAPVRLRLTSVSGADNDVALPPAAHWPPSPDVLSFSPDVVTVPAHGQAEIHPVLRIPKGREWKGRMFLFAVKAEPDGPVPGSVSKAFMSRIVVSTEQR